MALSDVELNIGSGGAKIAVDVIGGDAYEVVKQAFGVEGTATMVDGDHPLPVTDTIAEATLLALLEKMSADPATQTTLAAILAKLISAPATEAKQDTGNTSLASIDSKLTNPLPVSGTVTTGGLTDTQLRATPVPISGTVSTGLTQPLTDTQLRATPVPVSGTVTVDTALLATSAKQDTGNASLASIDAGIPLGLGQTTMAASMPVVLASNQSAIPVTFSGSATDNTILYNNTLSVTGAISGLDTTGYSSISIQIGGTWAGNLVIEGCNDNASFLPLFVLNANELSMVDVVYGNGNYILKTATKWVRINVNQLQSGSLTALILGRTTIGLSAADILSFAMDRANNSPLYIEETASKKDQSNGLIPSDAIPITGLIGTAANSTSKPIDTTGYQSIVITLGTISGTPNMAFQRSNDLATWTSIAVKAETDTTADITATNGAGTWATSVKSRYFRILNQSSSTAPTSFVAYLRQQPIQSGIGNVNLSFVGGTAAGLNTGTTGALAVGGTDTTGVTPTTRPIQVGGVDENVAVRRILLDTSGRTRISVTGQDGTSRALSGFSPSTNQSNIPALAIVDVSSTDGMTTTDLLAQLLLEMRIANQYLYELPKTLQIMLNDTQKSISISNEPSEYRNDQSWYQ